MTDETAIHALETATKALTKIEGHEAECARRWGTVRNLMVGIVVALAVMLVKQFGALG